MFGVLATRRLAEMPAGQMLMTGGALVRHFNPINQDPDCAYR